MARSSKKKISERLDWNEIAPMCEAFEERMITKVGTIDGTRKKGFIHALASAPRRSTIIKALDVVGENHFTIDDGKVRVDTTLVQSVYNTRLHASVSYFMVETFVKDGEDVNHDTCFVFKNSYSSENKESLYEAIDSIVSDMTDLGAGYYRRAWDAIEDKQCKK